MSEIVEKIDKLRGRRVYSWVVEDIPDSSRFLHEMDYDNLMKSNIHNKTYCLVSTEATIYQSRP